MGRRGRGLRQGGRSGRVPRARSRGSFWTPRSSSRRAHFSLSSPTRRRASAAPTPRPSAQRGRLELAIFRAIPLKSLDDLDRAFGAAREAATDYHAHPGVRGVGEHDRQAAEALARDVARVLAPLRALQPSASLSDCLALHRAAVLSAVARPRAEAQDAGEDLRGLEPLSELMDEWSEAATESFPTTLSEYAVLFDEALAAVRAPPANGGHPRLQILGLLEARLLEFDCMLLAGLDETVWPPAVETDAFLNRPMRAALGLTAPERRIGQTAHDFVAALGAREAILSRARKRGGEPTVASRFLQRLAAAAGAGSQAIDDAEERGRRYLAFARTLDQAGRVAARAKAGAAPAGRGPSPGAQRHPDRDVAARPLRDLCRIHSPPEAARRRSNATSARGKPEWPGTRRSRNSSRPARSAPSLSTRASACLRLHAPALRRFAPIRRLPPSTGPMSKTGSTSFSLSSAKRAATRRRSGSSSTARSQFRSRAARPSSSAPGQTELTFCSPAARGSSTTRADRRRAPAKSRSDSRRNSRWKPPSCGEADFQDCRRSNPSEALYLKLGGAGGGAEKRAGGKDADIRKLAEKHFAGLTIAARGVRAQGDALSLTTVPQIREPLLGLRPSRTGQGMGDRRR